MSELGDQGLSLVFTSTVVDPTMRVEVEPAAAAPRQVLEEIVRAHGLAVREVGERLVIVPGPVSPSKRRRASKAPVGEPDITLLPVTIEEIVVTPSHTSLLADWPSTLAIDQQTMDALPRFGDDLFRSLSLFAGTTSAEISARISIRGGREDEVLVLFDGLELLEPFHLKDFDSPLSILAPNTLGQIELITGGYSAEYGDRLSGVLNMTSIAVSAQRRTELGLSIFNVQALNAGALTRERGRFLVSWRGGTLEPALELAGSKENPTFWDGFAKLELPMPERHSLRIQTLLAQDRLAFSDLGEEEAQRFRTRYFSSYAWATHQSILGANLVVESTASWSRISRDRVGEESNSDGDVSVQDNRLAIIAGLTQNWHLRLNDRHLLRWGFDLRNLDVDYDYANQRDLTGALALIRDLPGVGTTRLDQSFTGHFISGFVTDRFRPHADLTLELGLRFDESSITDDEGVVPRANLVWAVTPHSTLRVAWGLFSQTQRLNELQVEDGETAFQRAERAEHRILGFDHTFVRSRGRPIELRAELYERRVRNPRIRYENLFDPISIVPELGSDRVRIDAERSRAHGFELVLRGQIGHRLRWMFNYAYARSEDRLAATAEDDRRWIPRPIDQPQTVVLDADIDLPWHLRLNVAFRAHSGRPTTAIDARRVVSETGEIAVEPVLGPLYGRRLSDYQRADLRLSREWSVGRGTLVAFLEVQNAFGHGNAIGFEVDLALDAEGRATVVLEEEDGLRRVPWLGVRWRF